MARSEDENFAIRQKTQEMISLGYPTEQAQAIAFRMFRDKELIIPKTKMDRQTLQAKTKMRAARSANAILLLYQLAKQLSK